MLAQICKYLSIVVGRIVEHINVKHLETACLSGEECVPAVLVLRYEVFISIFDTNEECPET